MKNAHGGIVVFQVCRGVSVDLLTSVVDSDRAEIAYMHMSCRVSRYRTVCGSVVWETDVDSVHADHSVFKNM